MPGVNLIPVHRRAGRRRRQRVRRWISICSACALAAGVGIAACRFACGPGERAVAEGLDKTAGRVALARQQIAELKQQLFESQRLLAASRVLADQPDWSLLLATVSGTLGEEIVLQSCDLKPEGASGGPGSLLRGATADPAGRFVLALRGYGRSQAAVAQFVLRLERTGLFEQVQTVKIKREELLGREAVGFQLRCLLRNRSEGKP